MTRVKRTAQQREADLETVQKNWLKGLTHREIADLINEMRGYSPPLSRRQVSKDIQGIRTAIRDRMDRDAADELARIDNLEREAWDEYERSKKTFKMRRKRKTEGGEGPGKTVKEVRKEERLGDPRYLERISWCIEQRCKILGFYDRDQTEKKKALTFAELVALEARTGPDQPETEDQSEK